MRADRLVATLLLMQARGRVTAAELATELEISVATARRDLEALSSAGIPVYPQAGRGGGWQLLGAGRTDLSGSTASEARALFLTLGPRAGESEAARSALRKVMRALPETFRAEAEAAAESVVVEAADGGRRPSARQPSPCCRRPWSSGARCASTTRRGAGPRVRGRCIRSGSSTRAAPGTSSPGR
ncbi:helix-turn-helix transcriptional regulator [Agromyces aureus]|uniref:helix-turn-helix transcriptional regulator n=1 Tax=Agromyces aureus TaxID=453304 RepID=UPI000ACC45C8|nr:HTH domain-containing protein [Agromyces aureus]